MSDPLVLAVELGGTTARAALVETTSWGLVDRIDRPSPQPGTTDADRHDPIVAAIADLAADVLDGRSPEAVGIAFPGPIDPAGRVLAAPTLLRMGASPEPFDLRAACRRLWPGAAVEVLNDLTAAGFYYASTGLSDFAVVTVGSGVGHKVFLDGVPRVGHGRGGELGHLRMDLADDAALCDCGGRGHLGALASGRGTVAGIARAALADPAAWARSALSDVAPAMIDGLDVARAFRAGDPFTVAEVRKAVRYLGQALAAVHLDTGIEQIVIIGGFAHGLGEDYRRLLVEAASEACWDLGQRWDEIVVLGSDADDAALLGAARAATRAVR
jgi:predicted NBD/HSP70 family sugar kinase